jgi:hypothetical protein
MSAWGGNQMETLAVADLNGDGTQDIVTVVHNAFTQVTVYLGNGQGEFADALSFPGASSQSGGSFLIGDLNRDGKLDLIVTRQDGWRVLLNTCQ